MKVKCPRCKKHTEYSTKNPARPFCSERCRLIDLGDWIEENHTIVEPAPGADLNDLENQQETTPHNKKKIEY